MYTALRSSTLVGTRASADLAYVTEVEATTLLFQMSMRSDTAESTCARRRREGGAESVRGSIPLDSLERKLGGVK